MKFLFGIAVPIYILDQLTKWLIIHQDRAGLLPKDVTDFFQLVCWHNTGAAFSMGDGKNWIFIVISVVAFFGILIAWHRNAFVDRASRWGIALLMGGLLGNLTDRIIHGHVIDFLKFDFGFWPFNPWPAFNVADSAICIAVGLLLVASFFAETKKPAATSGQPSEPSQQG